MWDPAGELHHLLAPADFTERIGDHLAVLGGDDLGQLVLARVEQLTEVEQDRAALGQRGIPPRRKRRHRRINHRPRILHTGQRHLTSHLTGRRIRHRGGGGRGAGIQLVVDPMSDCVGSHCRSPVLVDIVGQGLQLRSLSFYGGGKKGVADGNISHVDGDCLRVAVSVGTCRPRCRRCRCIACS